MELGLYIHIPFCLQKCAYCDFAVLPSNHSIGSRGYTELILQEIQTRSSAIPYRKVKSIYFGGGTPSLLDPEDILSIRREFANAGFLFSDEIESTIEINPGTVDVRKLDLYRGAGINRFSIGVQTFHDETLRALGREHSAEDSRKSLRLLIDHKLNYSFDLMFGLPKQTFTSLDRDLDELLSLRPPHVSLYNLTIPKSHRLNNFRATDDEQAEMFEHIAKRLADEGILRYEISNFAKPGFESSHNQIYWSGGPYWGVGLSSHSYLPKDGPFGSRFWNPRILSKYSNQVHAVGSSNPQNMSAVLPTDQYEKLKIHESLTDYFHTRLRMVRGFSRPDFERDFPGVSWSFIEVRLRPLLDSGLLSIHNGFYALSERGRPLADRSFYALTFTEQEMDALPH